MNAIFLLLVGLAILLFYRATTSKAPTCIFIIWGILLAPLAYSELFLRTPTLFPLVLISTVAISYYIHRITKTKSNNISILLGIHIIRIPVEFLLYQLYKMQKIPVEMTFKGWNFDIVIGISAIVLLIVYQKHKSILSHGIFKLWSFFGILSLGEVVVIGILSSPIPIQQFAFDRPNVAILAFPFVLLPGIIVPIVFLSHFLLWRKTNEQKNESKLNS